MQVDIQLRLGLIPGKDAVQCITLFSTFLEVKMAFHDSASPELMFQQAIDSGVDDDDSKEEEDQEEGEDEANKGSSTMDWVDNFILNTHCKGGQQTKTSVLKLYKVWLPGALRNELIQDDIINDSHIIHYLKDAPTHCLLTKQGKEKETDDRLSAVCFQSPSANLSSPNRTSAIPQKYCSYEVLVPQVLKKMIFLPQHGMSRNWDSKCFSFHLCTSQEHGRGDESKSRASHYDHPMHQTVLFFEAVQLTPTASKSPWF
ncbi:hypothetical protein L208DRAFT_1374199 [Tricholoma matsutake]|nr:hypothetical protein L208DRAFT_1374199 [Tricholoma matsutake 945]